MGAPGRHGRLAAATALCCLLLAGGGALARADSRLDVTAEPVVQFDKAAPRERFGALDFIGGFSFWSDDSRMMGISAFRFLDGGSRFLAATDTGFWMGGRVARDGAGRPVGIADATLDPILGPDGRPYGRKGEADAEGMAIAGDRAVVSFESRHRIAAYDLSPDVATSRPAPLPLPIPRRELRSNKGLETMAAAPASSPLAGALVTVAEHSIDENGNLFAAILDGRAPGIFKVRKDADWEVSDGTFLPGGDLLLLERRYDGWLGGLGIRIRRVAGDGIRPGALVDGPVIAAFDLDQEIDNMEAIDAWIDDSGATRLTLVSDDNGSFFQRNMLLEFRLAEDAARTN
ncbi:esterase-like activity of phytase family protein [Aurantimonas sp. A2-1-M11]|uniref:esterase-like activity of phytase family protein n=1 Tax=Aurantimonas sp. A2-1-M11 TaxID=3113712 RepID=UPI002F921347